MIRNAMKGAAVAAAVCSMFVAGNARADEKPRPGSRPLRRHQRLQGARELRRGGQRLQGPELLQGQGLGRDEEREGVHGQGRQGRRREDVAGPPPEPGAGRGPAPGFTHDPRLDLGHGIGLRTKHFARFLAERPPVDWVEA